MIIFNLKRFFKALLLEYDTKNIKSIMVKKKNNDDDGGVKAFLLGLGIGAIGYAIMSFFNKPTCPKCNNLIERYKPVCPHCKTPLEWKVK